MVIEIKHGGPHIKILAKLQEFDDKYKDKLNLKIILFNKAPSTLESIYWFDRSKDKEYTLEDHKKYNKNYYCFICQGECKISEREKDSYYGNFLSIEFQLITNKDYEKLTYYPFDRKEEIRVERNINHYYWKDRVLDTVNKLIELTDIDKDHLIYRFDNKLFNKERQLNDANKINFYETKEEDEKIKTGNYIYTFYNNNSQFYSDQILDQISKELEKE